MTTYNFTKVKSPQIVYNYQSITSRDYYGVNIYFKWHGNYIYKYTKTLTSSDSKYHRLAKSTEMSGLFYNDESTSVNVMKIYDRYLTINKISSTAGTYYGTIWYITAIQLLGNVVDSDFVY